MIVLSENGMACRAKVYHERSRGLRTEPFGLLGYWACARVKRERRERDKRRSGTWLVASKCRKVVLACWQGVAADAVTVASADNTYELHHSFLTDRGTGRLPKLLHDLSFAWEVGFSEGRNETIPARIRCHEHSVYS